MIIDFEKESENCPEHMRLHLRILGQHTAAAVGKYIAWHGVDRWKIRKIVFKTVTAGADVRSSCKIGTDLAKDIGCYVHFYHNDTEIVCPPSTLHAALDSWERNRRKL